MQRYVCKFGGSSLADAAQFKKVHDIVKAREVRKYVIASAPGKRYPDDIKVTDMLYSCYYSAAAGQDYKLILGQIKDRFVNIISDLGIDFDIDTEINVIDEHLASHPEKDYMASRGEYLNSKILAAYLGFSFLDAAE